ncbi:Reverse transcriptase domain-containing protein [Strongyloides ratti]|uniref:RNA-directed DNA polymerase n=1 Tax=Strongyloides ratti TaxID=34506 RepID=A0A090KWN9_STRRB|nr:Reverse transcriptase domain-containing protein [Strongyloides ratti]CEF60262.1 Reverse transcriptase domain-containing protein [Strongyloides ratti]
MGVWSKIDTSEWISPMSVAIKSNGRVRLCANFKPTINKVIEHGTYQIPTSAEIFSKLVNCKIFSSIDISDAFLQVRVDEESSKLLVVSTPLGLRRYERLPFGLSTSPIIFQEIMASLLDKEERKGVYYDDIVIGGRTKEEHNVTLFRTMEILQSSGFKLNIEKTKLGEPEIKYLGLKLNANGISPDEEKIRAITMMPYPKDVSEVRAFRGMLMYHLKFIPNLSIISKPLSKLTKKNCKFYFGREEKQCFDKLKTILTSGSVFTPYNKNEKVIFAANASQYGYRACVLHQFKNGDEKPIEYISKTFNKSQLSCSQIEKELTGIINGTLRLKDYLIGRSFVLRTDSQPLKFLLDPDANLPTIMLRRVDRWLYQLRKFDFVAEYVPTQKFGYVDALSRLLL